MTDELGQKGILGLGVGSLALAIWADLLFYSKAPGISYPLFLLSLYGLFWWQASQGERIHFTRQHAFSWAMTVPILMLASTFVLFSNTLFHLLNFLLVPFLFVVQTILLTERNRKKWYTVGFLGDLIEIALIYTLRHIRVPFGGIKEWIKSRVDQKKYGIGKKIAAGIGISVPILLVVLSLLSQADGVFGFFLGEIPRLFWEMVSVETVFRLFLIGALGVGMFAYLFTLVGKWEPFAEVPVPHKEEKPIVWDGVVLVTMLTIIDLVYVAFTAVQISYLFTGEKMILPAGMTYAEYAKNGFNELIMVTLINFLILLTTMHFASRAKRAIYRIIQALLSLLTVCTSFMLFSAYYRLSLYEAAYGYTYSRLLGHAFMIYLLIVFLIGLLKIWRDGFSLVRSYAIVGLVAYVLINYTNIDTIIVKNNLARYAETGHIDLDYLTGLSNDAFPYLLTLTDDPQIGEKVRRRLEYRLEEENESEWNWQSFNLSTYLAMKKLEEAMASAGRHE